MYSHCRNGGWILGNTIDGTQAEYVRIPHADTSLYALPADADEEALVMLSDILPTAFECGVLNGQVKPGDTVAIVGAGPIGLAALLTAQFYAPAEIIMIDLDANRLRWPGARRHALINSADGSGGAGDGPAPTEPAWTWPSRPWASPAPSTSARPSWPRADAGQHGRARQARGAAPRKALGAQRDPHHAARGHGDDADASQAPRCRAGSSPAARDPPLPLSDAMKAYDTFANAAKERALKVILQNR